MYIETIYNNSLVNSVKGLLNALNMIIPPKVDFSTFDIPEIGFPNFFKIYKQQSSILVYETALFNVDQTEEVEYLKNEISNIKVRIANFTEQFFIFLEENAEYFREIKSSKRLYKFVKHIVEKYQEVLYIESKPKLKSLLIYWKLKYD
jgi:hypothetical protein